MYLNIQVAAMVRALQMGKSFVFDPEHFASLRARRYCKFNFFAFKVRDGNFGSKGSLDNIDGDDTVEVGSIPLIISMCIYRDKT